MHGWPTISHVNMLFYPLYYDIMPNKYKITQTFHLLLGFAKNQIVFWDFKIWNSVRITEGLDNGDYSDNQGSTVLSNITITTTILLIALLEIIDLKPYHIVGKFGGENVWRIYFFRVFGGKVWWMKRLPNRLLIVNTNLNEFSLANHRWFAKFSKLSPAKLSRCTLHCLW